jgi:eukaryotic-like serine/threonine-protein kinase
MTPLHPSPHPAQALKPGERLGVWRLQRALAEVPSGQWWRAVHSVGSQTALALVYSHPEDAGAVLLRMAQGEGQPWKHPDIAWPVDSGLTADGRPYVIQPSLEGEPLITAISGASLRRRLEWAMQLCELLLLAGAKGLALVELDPSLLWVGPQHQLRLHALALVRSDAQAMRLGALQAQVSLAAQALQSPESTTGAPASVQDQVYTVGVLLCLLVNGRLAQGTHTAAPTVAALSHWVSLSAQARTDLDALLHQAAHNDPAARPADLSALGSLIEHWLDHSIAGPVSAPQALETTLPPPLPATPVPPTPPVPPPSRHVLESEPFNTLPAPHPNAPPVRPATRWLLSGVLLALVAVSVWLVLRG